MNFYNNSSANIQSQENRIWQEAIKYNCRFQYTSNLHSMEVSKISYSIIPNTCIIRGQIFEQKGSIDRRSIFSKIENDETGWLGVAR